MTNKNQPVKIRELVKPEVKWQGKHQAEAESLCEGFHVTCGSGYSYDCSGVYTSVADDHDLIF
jgi:hypothetical protein